MTLTHDPHPTPHRHELPSAALLSLLDDVDTLITSVRTQHNMHSGETQRLLAGIKGGTWVVHRW